MMSMCPTCAACFSGERPVERSAKEKQNIPSSAETQECPVFILHKISASMVIYSSSF